VAERRDQVKAELKELEAELVGLDNLIVEAIGPAAVGRLPDGSGFTLRTQNRKAFATTSTSTRKLNRVRDATKAANRK
jgi:hypothetical protein